MSWADDPARAATVESLQSAFVSRGFDARLGRGGVRLRAPGVELVFLVGLRRNEAGELVGTGVGVETTERTGRAPPAQADIEACLRSIYEVCLDELGMYVIPSPARRSLMPARRTARQP